MSATTHLHCEGLETLNLAQQTQEEVKALRRKFLQVIQKKQPGRVFIFHIMQMRFARDICYFGQDNPHYYFYYANYKTVYLF
jgi:hypothetical protein